MIQLPLMFEDPKPTPEQRGAQQLVEIQEYLHVWNARERARRLSGQTHQGAACSGLPRSTSQPESPGRQVRGSTVKWPVS